MKIVNTALLEKKIVFNSFTLKLAELIKERGEVQVNLRNGGKMTVVAYDRVEECFFSDDWSHAWNVDGTSCNGAGYDMMEMEI